MSKKFIFTDSQLNQVVERFPEMASRELFNWFVVEFEMDVQYTTFRTELYRHNLYKVRMCRWTDQEQQYLHDNYRTMGNIEIAKNLTRIYGRKFKKKQIEKKMILDSLKRTKSERQYIINQHAAKGTYAQANKKRWQEMGANPIGTICEWDKATVIKTEEGYVHYNRWLWQQHHNEMLTSEDVIRTIDHNLPMTIENLEKVTRAQNLQMMREGYLNLPTALKSLIRLNNKILKFVNHEQSK